MGECHRKIREGRPNFREDIKFFIGLPKQPLLELSSRMPFSLVFCRREEKRPLPWAETDFDEAAVHTCGRSFAKRLLLVIFTDSFLSLIKKLSCCIHYFLFNHFCKTNFCVIEVL